jgi:RimJ/RimL family protein N-acetyltransferase
VTAVVEFATGEFQPQQMRVTISEWNKRAQRVWENAGFEGTERFDTPKDFVGMGGGAFIVFVRNMEP